MPTEPRYKIIDNETGKIINVSTDELQTIYWLAEREARRRNNDAETSAAEHPLSAL